MGGIVPGNRGSSACTAMLPIGCAGRSSAHSSLAVAWAASIRARSTAGCSLNGSVTLTSLIRTGISWRCMSVASADESAFQIDRASGECMYAEDSTAMARGAFCSSRSAWMLPRPVIAAGRGRHRAARQDAEARAGQHGLHPVGPHAVFRHVAEVDLGGGRGLPAGEGLLVLQPQVLGYRPHRGDIPVGDAVGDPLERGEQGGRRPGIVAERRERLLERVEGLVRHLDRGPVQGRAFRGHPGREALELHPGQRAADVEFLLLAVLDAHREGQHPDVAVAVPPADLAGHVRRALDALITEGETDRQHVGELDGADVRDVAQPGAAVDQHVVVILLHVLAHGAEEPAAAEPVVEVVPVQRADRGGIVAVLPAGGEEVQPAAVGERPFQGDGVPLDPREL